MVLAGAASPSAPVLFYLVVQMGRVFLLHMPTFLMQACGRGTEVIGSEAAIDLVHHAH
ncbi:hypothetical protein [Parendozoicomonas sp. Alg238-R29]|uniref:hypothetical protein n=1 Tax=Parendozoicomonas sp. Alg238-R29 TaxID=2993446 RepID=UPI00248DF170|nr:hypothetical protein [Parendozoicomonas sp. Alg238-R29]